MLKLDNISKSFDKKLVLDQISFEIKKGEVVGLLGPNGAGKTTTMRLITGFLTPNSGQIKINNRSPKSARDQIGYLPEGNPLYSQLTPKEYLQLIAKIRQIAKDEIKDKIESVTKDCGLSEVLNQKIDTLSRGYRQRVGLAAAMIHDPQLLIMDEPTTGLDPNQQDEIRQLIKRISKNKAILFSTHILPEAESICQRVIIINKGQIVAQKNLKKLKKGALAKLFNQLTK
ncbi:MAG: ABC transporter ATP-binding protein [Patescibacteria group bacterium]